MTKRWDLCFESSSKSPMKWQQTHHQACGRGMCKIADVWNQLVAAGLAGGRSPMLNQASSSSQSEHIWNDSNALSQSCNSTDIGSLSADPTLSRRKDWQPTFSRANIRNTHTPSSGAMQMASRGTATLPVQMANGAALEAKRLFARKMTQQALCSKP